MTKMMLPAVKELIPNARHATSRRPPTRRGQRRPAQRGWQDLSERTQPHIDKRLKNRSVGQQADDVRHQQ